MRRGLGGKRTRARKRAPWAPVSTRRPVARSKGSREARGRGARPSTSSGFLAKERGVWGLHPGNGLGGSLRRGSQGTGSCLQLPAISFPQVAHTCPWSWLGPLGVPRQIEASCQQRTLPQVCGGWALAQGGFQRRSPVYLQASGGPHPQPQFRPLSRCARSLLLPGPSC